MHEIGRLVIGGLSYVIAIATAEEVPALADAFGVTSTVQQKIFLREGQSHDQMRDSIVHELVHAFLECTGIGAFMAGQVRSDWDTCEEVLIRLLTPNVIWLLDSNGDELGRLLAAPRKSETRRVGAPPPRVPRREMLALVPREE